MLILCINLKIQHRSNFMRPFFNRSGSYLLSQGPAGCSDPVLVIVVGWRAGESEAHAGLILCAQVAEELRGLQHPRPWPALKQHVFGGSQSHHGHWYRVNHLQKDITGSANTLSVPALMWGRTLSINQNMKECIHLDQVCNWRAKRRLAGEVCGWKT